MAIIHEKLEKAKKSMIDNHTENDVVKSVKLLENSDAMEDIRIATALGNANSVSRALKERGEMIELEKLDGKYAGNVYDINQIKDLARKYDLRFLQSTYYCGNLDLEVIQKLKQFSKDTGTEITDGNLKYNFYILAPEKCFDLKTVEVNGLNFPDLDPAIFYKISEDKFRLIHQWGNSFSIGQRIRGIVWESRESRFKFSLSLLGILIVLIGVTYNLKLWSWGIILSTLIGLTIVCIYSFNEIGTKDEMFHDYKWRSTDRIKVRY